MTMHIVRILVLMLAPVLAACGESPDRNRLAEDMRQRVAEEFQRGLLTLECGRLRIPDYGRPYARVIASLFDQYRQPDARRFSNAI